MGRSTVVIIKNLIIYTKYLLMWSEKNPIILQKDLGGIIVPSDRIYGIIGLGLKIIRNII